MPHSPPNPSWPEHVKRIYADGCARIDQLRKQIDADGMVPLPFRCYGCDKMKSDFGMLTGDRCPMCEQCLNTMAGI